MARVGVWMRLMHKKKGECTITPQDRVHLGEDIDRKLDSGWTDDEVVNVLQWTEYFNNEDSEQFCLDKITEGYAAVKARLALTKSGFIPLLILTHITDERGVDYCVKLSDAVGDTRLVIESPTSRGLGFLQGTREFYKGEAIRRAAQDFYFALVKIAAQMEEEARNG